MSLQPNKTHAKQGHEVAEHLASLDLDTPMVPDYWSNLAQEADEAKRTVQTEIEESFRHIMTLLGLDMSDDSLEETPKRVAKMFLYETFWGLDWNNFPKVTVVSNKMKYDEMVIERDITVSSTCEHHFLPILGRAHIAYIPGQKVPGLSKLNRIVEFFSRRPQIQERLTAQIHAALCYILETDDVAVIIEAEHMCVKTRGVEDPCSDTVTSKISGVFKHTPRAKEEMLAFIMKTKTY